MSEAPYKLKKGDIVAVGGEGGEIAVVLGWMNDYQIVFRFLSDGEIAAESEENLALLFTREKFEQFLSEKIELYPACPEN
jgi:hypothetical protein